MLVLTRRTNEECIIRTPEGRDIIVNVVEARPGKVRLGFAADREVEVHRSEVFAAIHGAAPTSVPVHNDHAPR